MVSRSSSWRCFELLAGDVDGGVQLAGARLPGVALHFDQVGRLLEHFLGRDEGLAGRQRLQARRLGQQRQVLGVVLAQRGGEAGGVDLEQDLAGLDLLAGFHQDFLDDAAVRLWMICTWREGTTLPSPRTTSSMLPKPAHSNKGNGQQAGPQQHAGAARLRFVDDPFGVADVVVALLRLALSAPSSRRSKPYTKTLRSLSQSRVSRPGRAAGFWWRCSP